MTGIMRNVSVYVLTCLVACAVAGCAGRGGRDGPPNVVIITMDTVRADHLGCYGYAIDTTPRLDELAARSTRYERVVASSSWTVPTHASFFTGKFAFEHGAHGFRVTDREDNAYPLPDGELTLAEVFWDERYATGAFVANDAFLGARWQLNQGFETYHVERAPGDELNERVFAWLDAVSRRPFFLFVNYMDAHRPYNARPVGGLLPRRVVADEGALLDSLYAVVMPGTNPVPAGLKRRVVDQYDTAIRNLDAAIGDLVDRLEKLRVLDNTVLVVASDHGEFFGEHSLVEHSKDVYEEVVSVPLIIKFPGQTEGTVDGRLVSATDVPGLVLSSFSGEEWETHRGRFPDAPGNHEVISELYYTRTKDLLDPVWGKRFDRVQTAVYDWPLKYIASSDGENELYDLASDPSEATNLVETKPDEASRLADRLAAFVEARGRAQTPALPKPLSDEERRRLKSLGYIGD